MKLNFPQVQSVIHTCCTPRKLKMERMKLHFPQVQSVIHTCFTPRKLKME